MTATVTVRPIDARRRALPVACRITLKRGERILQTAACRPGDAGVDFTKLPFHQVYAATIAPDRFKVSAQLIPVAARDRAEAILCLVHFTRVEPQFPDYSRLPLELQLVLERSSELDAVSRERSTPDRHTDDRSLDQRLPVPERSTPARPVRDVRAGSRRWERLDPEQRAGLLNLFAKLRSVTLASGRTAWSYVDALKDVQRDRVHLVAQSELRGQTHETLCFDEAFGLLHRGKPGLHREKSFKTREPYGNLQMTFFVQDGDTLPTVVDADVDDAAGVEHAEQVVGHWIGGAVPRRLRERLSNLPEDRTHPFDIHQLLVHYQTGGGAHINPYEPYYVLRLRDAPSPYAI